MIERIFKVDEKLDQQIRECGNEFHEEAKLPGLFCRETFLNSWGTIIKLGFGALWRATEEDRLVGMFGALLSPDLCDGKIVAAEAFWFVRKSSRGGTVGLRLFREFESWGRNVGANRLIMTHLLSSMPEKLKNFYEREGFVAAEISYVKQL